MFHDRELLRLSRPEIEARIEALIALLDILDGDPDFEPDTDGEPSLGWHMIYDSPATNYPCDGSDRELDDELNEDGGDEEPDPEDLPFANPWPDCAA